MLCSALAGVQMKAAFELSIAAVATIAHLAHRHEANKRALCDASAAAADSPLFRTLVRMLESASTYSPSALHASAARTAWASPGGVLLHCAAAQL